MDEKLLVFIEQIGSQDALTDSAPVSAHREHRPSPVIGAAPHALGAILWRFVNSDLKKTNKRNAHAHFDPHPL